MPTRQQFHDECSGDMYEEVSGLEAAFDELNEALGFERSFIHADPGAVFRRLGLGPFPRRGRGW